jgi:hypothetical protein
MHVAALQIQLTSFQIQNSRSHKSDVNVIPQTLKQI